MTYQTVFRIGLHSFPWIALLVPVVLLVAGAAVWRFAGGRGWLQAAGAVLASGAAGLLLIACATVLQQSVRQWWAYARGRASIAEGRVTDLHIDAERHSNEESMTIAGKEFAYAANRFSPCFQNAPAGHGPLHAGMNARVFFWGDCIVRVDLADSGANNDQQH